METIKRHLRDSAAGQWVLNRALSEHMKDFYRFSHGPVGSSLWGVLYFKVLM